VGHTTRKLMEPSPEQRVQADEDLLATLIDIEVLDLIPVSWCVPTIIVYDNKLVYEWSQDQENDSNIRDVKICR
jgi:hypothetical protein